MSELQLCPKCQKGHLKPTGEGHLKPTGEVATDVEGSEQVGERGETRKFVCDNPECEMHKSDLVHTEYVSRSDSSGWKLTRAEDRTDLK